MTSTTTTTTNPADVSVADLLAAFKAEKAAQGWCRDADTYLRRTGLVAQYPQWDPATSTYDEFAPNPNGEYGDRIPTNVLLEKAARIRRSYPTGVDAVLARVGVTYVEYDDTYTVTLKATITSSRLRDTFGRTYVPADPSRVSQGEQLNLLSAVVSMGRDELDELTIDATPDPRRAARPAAE